MVFKQTSTLLGAVLASLCWAIMPSAAQALDLQAVKQPFEELTRQSTQRYPLAIMPLQDQTGATVQALNRYLEGELLQLFTELPAFQVLERSQIQQLLKEQGFSQSVYVSPEAAVAVGKMLGARLILTGHYTNLPQAVQLHLRLVDAESGRILKVVQTDLPKDEVLYALLGEMSPEQRTAQEQKAFQDNMLNTALNVTGALAKAYLDNQRGPGGLPGQPFQPALPAQPGSPAQGGYAQPLYFQDFSGFQPGTVLPSWGVGMVVRQSQRHPMHVLTTENPAVRKWQQALPLPEDFVLELHAYDQSPDGSTPLQLDLRSADGQRQLQIHKLGSGFAVGNRPLQFSTWQTQAWNVIALKKEGLQLTLLVNGQPVTSEALSTPYWRGLTVQSALMNRWAFTRLGVFRP